jgi:soluble lytic murein transglycosylase-like protein
MKAITITLALAVVSTPALARKADHQKRKHHHHARVVVTDMQPPFGSGPMAQPMGWNAQARAPRVARDAAPGQGAYADMVARHAAANGVPASLVHRVIMRESRYNPRAVSKGNYGMMQIKLGTARAMGYTGSAAGLLDPETNMTYAVKYLAGAYKVAGGSESGAVANYARGYYHSAKRRGVSPYESPGYASFAMQPTVVMQTSAPARSSRRAARVNPENFMRTPSDRHAVF